MLGMGVESLTLSVPAKFLKPQTLRTVKVAFERIQDGIHTPQSIHNFLSPLKSAGTNKREDISKS